VKELKIMNRRQYATCTAPVVNPNRYDRLMILGVAFLMISIFILDTVLNTIGW